MLLNKNKPTNTQLALFVTSWLQLSWLRPWPPLTIPVWCLLKIVRRATKTPCQGFFLATSVLICLIKHIEFKSIHNISQVWPNKHSVKWMKLSKKRKKTNKKKYAVLIFLVTALYFAIFWFFCTSYCNHRMLLS